MKIKTLSLICIVLITLVLVPSANAVFHKGNDLYNWIEECDKKTSSSYYFKCGLYMGYIDGIYEATEYLYKDEKEITTGQIHGIVKKYLKEHPERWHEIAIQIVVDALKEAFPNKQ